MRLSHNCKLATMSFVENGSVERSKHKVVVENKGGVCIDAAHVLHPNSPAMQCNANIAQLRCCDNSPQPLGTRPPAPVSNFAQSWSHPRIQGAWKMRGSKRRPRFKPKLELSGLSVLWYSVSKADVWQGKAKTLFTYVAHSIRFRILR